MTKHLFIVNGLGLGNSTRCQALIDELHASGAVIDIITSGNGLRFFRTQARHRHLIPQGALFYGEKFGWRTLIDVLRMNGRQLLDNARIQQNWIAQENYQQIWIDSDYSYLFWRKKTCTLTLVNHAYFTIIEFWQLPIQKILTCLGHYIVEVFDFLLSLYRSDRILCPDYFKRNTAVVVNKIHLSPSLVRKLPPPLFLGKKRLVISLSGYSLPENTQLIVSLCQKITTPTLVLCNAADELPALPEHVEVREKIFNDSSYLREAHTLITNAGYSTLSEAVELNIPLVLVPIEGHAEQQVNAARMMRAGAAISLPYYLSQWDTP